MRLIRTTLPLVMLALSACQSAPQNALPSRPVLQAEQEPVDQWSRIDEMECLIAYYTASLDDVKGIDCESILSKTIGN